MVERRWSSSSLSCGGRLLLRCDGNPGNSVPNKQGKDPSSQARRRKGDSSGCGQDSRPSSRVETGMWGNSLSCSKGLKDPLEVPEVRCDLPRDASAEWASSRLEARTSWIFSSCGRCSRLTTGALDLRRGPQGPALVASGKSSPHASCSGASRGSSPIDARA